MASEFKAGLRANEKCWKVKGDVRWSVKERCRGSLRKTKVQGNIKKKKTLCSLTGERAASSDHQKAPVVLSQSLEDTGVRFDLNQGPMSTVISIQADNPVTNTCSGSILHFCSLSEAASLQQMSISRNFFFLWTSRMVMWIRKSWQLLYFEYFGNS